MNRRQREGARGKVMSHRSVAKESLGEAPKEPRRLPVTRGECASGERPCPFVTCRQHLYLDATPSGGIKVNFPDVSEEELEKLPETCALDVADRDPLTLDEIGVLMNLTRERVRQIEEQALRRMARLGRDVLA